MNPERWQQIDGLLQEALERPAQEFAALLDQSCANDESLRQDVESLIKYRKLSENFLEVPVLEAAAELLSEGEARIGLLVGSYKIEAQLGVGGMGEVYLAHDTQLDRKVAIKFLPPELEADELAKKRLIREAKAAAKLDHPNICSIYDIAEEDGLSYIVMQYLEGETLASRLERKVVRLHESNEVALQVADALVEAHSRGIIHRDIKPQNIMITPRGQVKVLDFGLAKLVAAEGRTQIDVQTEQQLSAPGIIVGTPPYMSPEQAKGSTVDARSDLFSLGTILYECVAGRAPFSGETGIEVRAQVIHLHPVRPSELNPAVRPEFEAVILKALAKAPDDRYQSARDLLTDLQRLRAVAQSEDQIKTQPIPLMAAAAIRLTLTKVSLALRRPRILIPAVSAVVVLMVALGLVQSWRDQPPAPSREASYWYAAGTNFLRHASYDQATRALQQAVTADDQFALAHARLAEAYSELDYSDKAKHEILRARALVHDLSPLPKLDALYLQAITNMVLREYSPAIETYKEIVRLVPEAEKPQAYVDLGRAYEKNYETDKAKESYEQATRLAPSDPAAFLRLGVLCGQKQDLKCAQDSFGKAEKSYRALGNFEGVTEVFFQRGFLLKNSEKLPEARSQLEEAIKLATTTANISQQMRSLLSLSSVAATEGHSAEAQQHATQAINLARANGIENQATGGLIWLGNAFLLRGEYGEAENYYQRALELARRDRGRFNEALALVQLGSLRIQQQETDEALHYIEQALPFFQQVGYRKELAQVLTLRGRAYRDKGDYEAALSVFREQLQLGEKAGDVAQMALSEEEIGSVLAGREDYAEALNHFDESYKLNQSLHVELYVGYSAMHRASVLWQIGRYEEAKDALDEAVRVAENPEGPYKDLLAAAHVVRALMEFSASHFPEAKAQSLQALTLSGVQYKTTSVQAKCTLGLIQARSGARRAGTQLCNEALDLATRTGERQLISTTRLACAEVLLANAKIQASLDMALQAQEGCARSGQLDSEWRAWLIAARASQQLGNPTQAHDYGSNATDRLKKLEQRLGPEAYKGYLFRSDVQKCTQQLSQIKV